MNLGTNDIDLYEMHHAYLVHAVGRTGRRRTSCASRWRPCDAVVEASRGRHIARAQETGRAPPGRRAGQRQAHVDPRARRVQLEACRLPGEWPWGSSVEPAAWGCSAGRRVARRRVALVVGVVLVVPAGVAADGAGGWVGRCGGWWANSSAAGEAIEGRHQIEAYEAFWPSLARTGAGRAGRPAAPARGGDCSIVGPARGPATGASPALEVTLDGKASVADDTSPVGRRRSLRRQPRSFADLRQGRASAGLFAIMTGRRSSAVARVVIMDPKVPTAEDPMITDQSRERGGQVRSGAGLL